MDDQFEDADMKSPSPAPVAAPEPPTATLITSSSLPTRQPGLYLDDDLALSPPSLSSTILEEEDEEDDEDIYDSDLDELDLQYERSLMTGLNEVMDQDWDVLSGDFTKRYNRMRQHVVATHASLPRSSTASSKPSEDPTVRPGNIVPASNRSKASAAAAAASRPLHSDPSAASGTHTNKVSDQLAAYAKYNSKIDLAPLFPTSAMATKKGGSEKILVKDKADRATVEQVLDPRTRLIIFKMIGRELIERVDGCVSTGKEANVYHAVAPAPPEGGEGKHLALKIYKTSILVFKDRDRYVSGEFRFKSGYARSNPRKMVRLWAEKEMRNLRRMRTAGMRVPEAYEVRENVLVMDFLGEDEWEASPRLKDAVIPAENLRSIYIEMLVLLRTIYARCKLVHADFSEYNVLYHKSHLWVIDVSQSVEGDHPHAFDFLRSDIRNADDFFAKRGLDTLGLTRTFAYVTRDAGKGDSDEEMTKEAERLLVIAENDSDDSEEEEEEVGAGGGVAKQGNVGGGGKEKEKKPSASDEAVFAQSYMPRTLDQVYDPERDVARVLRGEGKALIYADITGVVDIEKVRRAEEKERGVTFAEEEGEGEDGSGSEGESGSEDGSGSEDENGERKERAPRGKKHEDREDKKARRNETKEKAREKRSEKMSKGEKRRRVRKTSGKK
ncbi:RIO kinase 1, partial [Phenoliferia sp. Uapishka_3]